MLAKHRLMVPGPTPLPPAVVAAAVQPLEDERTPQYSRVFLRVVDRLRQVLRTRNDVLVTTSSMTGAFEGALVNLLSPGDHVLVATNGAFGERWVAMARAHGYRVTEVPAPWGRPVDMAEVARVVDRCPDLALAVCVHCETSTTVVNDLEAFAAACGDVLTLVDSASGVGACDVRTDDWGLDVVVAGGQKALMTPPGVAFTSISRRAWDRHRRATSPRFYFDWDAAADAMAADVPRTPWTPAISLLSQLDRALGGLLEEEGLDEALARHRLLGRMTRAAVRASGLGLVTDRDVDAAATAAVLPPSVDRDTVVAAMAADHGVQVVGAPGAWGARIVRLGHCGWIDPLDVVTTVAALELALADAGMDVELGAGVAAALRVRADSSHPVLEGVR